MMQMLFLLVLPLAAAMDRPPPDPTAAAEPDLTDNIDQWCQQHGVQAPDFADPGATQQHPPDAAAAPAPPSSDSDTDSYNYNPVKHVSTAFERLQYVAKALKVQQEHGGGFPYDFESEVSAQKDVYRMAVVVGIGGLLAHQPTIV
eukprot:SAG22_NODE_1325_length_4736_cov_5.253397_6_plen_145_part_00